MQVGGIWPTTTVLRGFGGGSVSGVCNITLGVTTDGVALNIDAIVIVYGLFDVDLLLCQLARMVTFFLGCEMVWWTLSLPEHLVKAITFGNEAL